MLSTGLALWLHLRLPPTEQSPDRAISSMHAAGGAPLSEMQPIALQTVWVGSLDIIHADAL